MEEVVAEKKQPSVFKASSWYLICDIVLKAISFLTAPFFNRMMSAEDVGNYSNIVSWASLLSIIVTLDLSSSIANAKFDFEGKKLDKYISSILLFGSMLSLLLLTIVLSFGSFFSQLFNIEYKYLVILMISFLVAPALTSTLYKLRFRMEYKKVVLITVVSTLASVIVPIILVLLLDNKLDGRVFGYYIPSIVVCLILYVFLIGKGRCFSWAHIKYALLISVPLALHAISGTILSSFDRIMITDMCGPADNALYSNAYIFGTILLIVWQSFNSAWVPWCFEKFKNDEFGSVRKYSKMVILPFALLFIMVTLLAPEGLFIIGGDYYVTAKYVVPPVMASCVATMLYTFYVNVELFYKKQLFIAIGTISAAAINILLNYFFIPIYGYVAAAYTTFFSFFLLLVFHFCIVKFYLKKASIYDTWFILIYLVVVLSLIGLCILAYSNNIARYISAGIIFVGFVVAAIKYRDKIKEVIHK